jgi:uncharacterized protein
MLVIPTRLQASAIHGMGVFATEPVPAGAMVSRYMPPFDVSFTSETVKTLGAVERAYLRCYAYRSVFNGVYYLVGDHDRFMNHSDSPNVGMNPDGTSTVLALRDIAPGEELTCDYRSFDADWSEKLSPSCGS